MWVSFSRHNVSDDLHSRLPRDIAEHIGQLYIHQMQCLLHMLDV